MSTGAIRAGKAFYEIFADDKTRAGLDSAQKRLKSFGAGVVAAGVAVQAAALVGLGAFGAAVHNFLDAGDELTKASDRTGILVDKLSALKYAAEQSDVSFGALQSGIRKMQQVLAKSGDMSGMSPDQQFLAIADAISRIEDPAKRTAEAMKYFGKAGVTLMPLLKEGAKGLAELQQRARELGLIVDPKDAKAATELGDSIADVVKQLKMMAFTVGAALAGPMKLAVDMFHPFGAAIIQIIKAAPGLVQALAVSAVVALAFGTALVATGTAIFLAGTLISSFMAIIAAMPAIIAGAGAAIAFLASPLGIVLVAVGALVAALPLLAYVLDQTFNSGRGLSFLISGFQQLWAIATQTINGISSALQAGNWELAGNIAMAGLNLAFQSGWSYLKIGFNDFFTWLSKKFIDFFGEHLIGIVTGGIAEIIKLVNKGSQFFTGKDFLSPKKFENTAALAANGQLKAKLDKASSDYARDAMAEIAGAQLALDTLTAQAAKEKETALAKTDSSSGVQSGSEFAGEQRNASGTFSASAATRLGMQGGVFQSIKDELKTQTDLLEGINDGVGDLAEEGAAFS